MKKLFGKFLILLIAILVGQVVVARYVVPSIPSLTFGIPGIGKLDTYLNLNDRYPILFFGDSIIKAYAENDKDKSSIPEMLAKVDSRLKIGDMSSPGYGLGVFEAMVSHIENSDKKPKAIIIPINLRSFSPQWDMRPEYQFEKEIFFLTHGKFVFYFSKPLGIFHAININSVNQDTFRKQPIYYGDTVVGEVGKYEDKAQLPNIDSSVVKDFYIYDYMGNLKTNHRKLQSLRNIALIAKENGVKVYVYITPIDYEEGAKLVGQDFIKQTKYNAELVCSISTENGLPCLNLAFAVRDADFATHVLPNEHMKEAGRKFVAQKLADFIKDILKLNP
jgi:hypothetical protein